MLQKKLHALISRLALLTAFCFFIESFRMLLTCNINYIFLPWNLILAWVPLYIAMQMKDETSKAKITAYLFAWLIFFPNAPYIITDFLHLKPRDNFPFWYDSILLFAFAFTGLLAGVISALLVHKKMKTLCAAWIAKGVMLLTMLISGYGIYVGRFLRYNSWDILTDPLQILSDTATVVAHPFSHPRTYGVTLMAGVLMTLVFFIFEPLFVAE